MDKLDKLVRKLLVDEDLQLKELTQKLHEHNNERPLSSSNLANKLSRDTLKYVEAQEIAEVLGYEIIWQKKAA